MKNVIIGIHIFILIKNMLKLYAQNYGICHFMYIKNLRTYVKHLAAHGLRSFKTEDAEKALNISQAALNASLHRLMKIGDITSPAKGFYLILSPEDQARGCLPAADFIPLLMQYWQIDYYAGLLTAATYHGATHQAIQKFYVMSKNQKRPIRCGKVEVTFIKNKHLEQTPTQRVTVKTGYLVLSTPEGTIMDLLNFPRQSGGLNHIATVLTELIEVITPEKLLNLACESPSTIWIQRLGYLLEIIEPIETENRDKCLQFLKDYLRSRSCRVVLLDNQMPRKSFPTHKVWKVIINTDVESDI